MQVYARNAMQGFASICKDMLGGARICKDMQGCASICKDMQSYASRSSKRYNAANPYLIAEFGQRSIYERERTGTDGNGKFRGGQLCPVLLTFQHGVLMNKLMCRNNNGLCDPTCKLPSGSCSYIQTSNIQATSTFHTKFDHPS